MQARADIARLDKAVVDAEDQDQRDLADKQQAEEEGQTLDRLVAAPLEGVIVELVDRHAEHKEDRHHDDADHDRVDPESGC